MPHRRGQDHGRAKLTDDQVRVIRTLQARGVSQAELARTYGVSAQAIHYVVSGKAWKHLL